MMKAAVRGKMAIEAHYLACILQFTLGVIPATQGRTAV
jgi:hypothetical protein